MSLPGEGRTFVVLLCAKACALPGNVTFHAGAWEATLIQAFGYALSYGVYDLVANSGSVEHRCGRDTASFAVQTIRL